MFVRQKRRGSARRPGARGSKAPARRGDPKSAKGAARESRLPAFELNLEQRHLDILGLGLIVLGVYLVFVLYLGWDGGKVGSALADGLTFMIGELAYAVPIALPATGLLLIFKPEIPSTRPLKTGVTLLAIGLLLAFAAGTMGIDGGSQQGDLFDSAVFPEHGGLIGEALFWLASTLFQTLGAHLIAIFCVLAGALLLTGTTIATVLARSHSAVRRAGAHGADLTRTIARTSPIRARRGTGSDEADGRPSEAGVTDVLDGYPEQDEVEPTVAIGDGDATAWLDEEAGQEPETREFDLGSAGAEEADAETGPDPDVREPESGGAGAQTDEHLAEPDQMSLTPMGERRGVTVADEIDYRPPPLKALERGRRDSGPDPAYQKELGLKLVEALGHFGVEAKIIGVVSGPHVSRYELRLAPGIKVKKVSELANDLAYALASTDIRILAPIPGKQAVGVEVPNATRKMVRLGDIYEQPPEKASPLLAWLGKGIDGKPVSADLAKMPHVLVAGTTGSGKSGCVNAILSSILMHSSPNETRLVLVDPKQVELNHYEAIPHLLTPVVTSPKLAANVLANLIGEMESRYGIMGRARARNLAELNKIRAREGEAPLPHILCVIDELADLMMVSPTEVEDSIIRLAQKSRATGIHLVLATQRPSTDIITGTIKVNIPARIAFAVSSQTDSRVILDQGGAEALLGQGDMLFRGPGTSKVQRIQGAFVTEDEIARITGCWAKQGEPEFEQEMLESKPEAGEDASDADFDPDQDDRLEEAIHLVVQTETASVSMIQRRLRVGYTRAGRLIDMLERRGVISGYEGSKPRQVLITEADLPRVLGQGAGEVDRPPEDADGAPSDAAAPDGAEGSGPAGEPDADRVTAPVES